MANYYAAYGPEDGGGTLLQARAANDVMAEIASNPMDYLDRRGEGVSDAVVDTGVMWMDTFTRAVGEDEAGAIADGFGYVGILEDWFGSYGASQEDD